MLLNKIAGGALQELFDRAYEKVLQNMKDPNTPWKDTRKVVITLSFRGNEARNKADMHVTVDTKTVNVKPVESLILFDKDQRSGKMVSKELSDKPVDPGGRLPEDAVGQISEFERKEG